MTDLDLDGLLAVAKAATPEPKIPTTPEAFHEWDEAWELFRQSFPPPTCEAILLRLQDAEQERDELATAHEFMAQQFATMQREKEHGWREAEKWEAKTDSIGERLAAAEKERDDWIARHGTIDGLRISADAILRDLPTAQQIYEALGYTGQVRNSPQVQHLLALISGVRAERDEARAALSALRESVTALADTWEAEAITCECRHRADEHDENGCFATFGTDLPRCSCGQDTYEVIAATALRSTLLPPTRVTGKEADE